MSAIRSLSEGSGRQANSPNVRTDHHSEPEGILAGIEHPSLAGALLDILVKQPPGVVELILKVLISDPI